MRILLVDDEPVMRRRLRDMLKTIGDFDIIEVENGSEALIRLQKTHFDIVISEQKTGSILGVHILGYVEKHFAKKCQFIFFSSDCFLVQDMQSTKRCSAFLKTELNKLTVHLMWTCSINFRY